MELFYMKSGQVCDFKALNAEDEEQIVDLSHSTKEGSDQRVCPKVYWNEPPDFKDETDRYS